MAIDQLLERVRKVKRETSPRERFHAIPVEERLLERVIQAEREELPVVAQA